MADQLRLELNEDRPLQYALTIACVECGAGVGEHCTTESGDYAAQTHLVRTRQASFKPIEGAGAS